MRRLCRVLFSRYLWSALIIICEIALILLLLIYASEYSVYALLFAVLVNILALVNLITRDANPEYKIPWLVVLICVPLLGTVLYILFYSRRITRREARFMMDMYKDVEAARDRTSTEQALLDNLAREGGTVYGKAISLLGEDYFSSLYKDSECKYLGSGEEMYSSMLESLNEAKEYIFLSYFIIRRGRMWDSIHEILKEKAKSGVEVRVMYDDIGCMRDLPLHYDRTLCAEGIDCVRFNPVSPSLSTTHNNRNHRKMCIIDGKVAYTGGVNISDEYINARERFGHWKDGGIQIKGGAVEGILVQFLCDFALAKRKKQDFKKYLPTSKEQARGDGGYYLPFGSGPSPLYNAPVGKRAFINIINQAERYVYVTTPYLIIDYELTEALRGAASRGVDVRIITPHIPDRKIVKVMTKSSYPYLIDAGVHIYEYIPGFIHEKMLISDGKYAIVGTINLDYRSLAHHFENAVWMYLSPSIADMERGFFETLTLCDEREGDEVRLTLLEKIIRNLIRVFAPLL